MWRCVKNVWRMLTLRNVSAPGVPQQHQHTPLVNITARLAGDVVQMTSAFVGSARLALQPGVAPLVKFLCNIVERHLRLHSALLVKHQTIAAALVVLVASEKMLWHIRAVAPALGKMQLNTKAFVDHAFLHVPTCAARVQTLLVVSTPEKRAKRLWKMPSKTLCAKTALARPTAKEATIRVNRYADVLVSQKAFASRATL